MSFKYRKVQQIPLIYVYFLCCQICREWGGCQTSSKTCPKSTTGSNSFPKKRRCVRLSKYKSHLGNIHLLTAHHLRRNLHFHSLVESQRLVLSVYFQQTVDKWGLLWACVLLERFIALFSNLTSVSDALTTNCAKVEEFG